MGLTRVVRMGFNIPFFSICSPEFRSFNIPITVHNAVDFGVDSCERFVGLRELGSFGLISFRRRVGSTIAHCMGSIITGTPTTRDVPLMRVRAGATRVGSMTRLSVDRELRRGFNIAISNISVSAVRVSGSDRNCERLVNMAGSVTNTAIGTRTRTGVGSVTSGRHVRIRGCRRALHVRHRRNRCTRRGTARSTGVKTFRIRGRTRINVTNTRTLKRVNTGNANNVSLNNSNKGNNKVKFGPTTVVTDVTINNIINRGVTNTVKATVSNVGRPVRGNVAPPPVPIITCRVTIGKRTTKPFSVTALTRVTGTKRVATRDLM